MPRRDGPYDRLVAQGLLRDNGVPAGPVIRLPTRDLGQGYVNAGGNSWGETPPPRCMTDLWNAEGRHLSYVSLRGGILVEFAPPTSHLNRFGEFYSVSRWLVRYNMVACSRRIGIITGWISWGRRARSEINPSPGTTSPLPENVCMPKKMKNLRNRSVNVDSTIAATSMARKHAYSLVRDIAPLKRPAQNSPSKEGELRASRQT